jgi:hypothetical protein
MSPTQHTDESPASGYLSTAWPTFEQKLAAVLADLTEDQYLILSVKRSSRFVQFAGQGAFGLRAETTSNSYLPKPEVLDNKQLEALLALGWQPPTGSPDASTPERDPDGSPNFFCDFAAPASCPSVARLAIRTLAEIFRVPHPGFLDYEAFDEQGPLDLSHLGLKLHQETAREGDPNRVRKRLLETLREVTGFADLEYDADGDIGVRIGSALVY